MSCLINIKHVTIQNNMTKKKLNYNNQVKEKIDDKYHLKES